MAQVRSKSRFEYSVHIGLAVIICLLLFLNFASNYVIYQARSTERQEVFRQLRRASVGVSRAIQAVYPDLPGETELHALAGEYELKGITILPMSPTDRREDSRRDWFREVLRRYPPIEYPDLPDILYRAEIGGLTRGVADEYYHLYPVPSGDGSATLVLCTEQPRLAYLDDARSKLIAVALVSLLLVAGVYAGLSRFIFRPFRQIRHQAVEAGRPLTENDDDTEAVVEEYRHVIGELRRQQQELIALNEEIQGRAESLEDFNKYLVESSQAGIITIDRGGRVTAINDTAARLLQLPAGSGVGENVARVLNLYPGVAEAVQATLDGRLAGGYREFVASDPTGSESTLAATLSLILNRAQVEVGLLLVINDLTELNRLKGELEEGRRLAVLGEMSAGLAHQLRNSLGAISGYGTLLKKHLMGVPSDADHAVALLEECREAEELIGRFLSFAKPLDYAPQPVRLGELFTETVAQARMALASEGVSIVCGSVAPVEIFADPVLVKQALLNLVDNAVRACEGAGGTVELSARVDKDYVRIQVEDTGCGIAPEDLDRIFTPFYSSRPSGTGLGLPLVRKVVDLHSGQIRVRSEPGRGTGFTVILPLHSPVDNVARPSQIGSRL